MTEPATSPNLASMNLDSMTPDDFQAHLPELFAAGSGRISQDPRFAKFLHANPTCEALVRDLEYIADAARQLLEPVVEEPSDSVWDSIQSKLKIAASGEEPA